MGVAIVAVASGGGGGGCGGGSSSSSSSSSRSEAHTPKRSNTTENQFRTPELRWLITEFELRSTSHRQKVKN